MRASKIRSLIKLVEDSNINELEVSSWGRKVSIRKKLSSGNGSNPGVMAAPVVNQPVAKEIQVEVAEKLAEPVKKSNLVEVKSPMVGTFYEATNPESPVYVNVGDSVTDDKVVCIVEAMKVMNEIKAGVSGTIEKVLVENGQAVEFGQPMFLVRPD